MKNEELPWSDSAVFICTKCHKAIPPDSLTLEGNAGENLKMYLKSKLRDLGRGAQVRVMTSSCLDVCLDGVQAILVADVNGQQQTFTLHPEQEKDVVLDYLKSKSDV